MSELKELIRDSFVVWFVGAVFLFTGVFGAVNWNSWVHPPSPNINSFTSSQEAEIRIERYNRAVEQIGQNAVIPFVWAVPLTIVGFFGAMSCIGVIINRNII